MRKCAHSIVPATIPFFCLLLAAFGCDKKTSKQPAPSPGQPVKLSLALNWAAEPEFGGFYAAREFGDFQQRGLAVEILGGSTGLPVLQMVASGQIDLGVVEGDELLVGRTRGLDIVPIFAVFQKNPKAIMTHASRGAKELKDILQSGTLALYSGMTMSTFLKKQFGWNGVKIVPHDGGISRFLADENYSQVCFATAEPLQAIAAGKKPQTFVIADYGFNPYTGVIAVHRRRVQDSPQLIRAFVSAARKGWERYLRDPAPANAIMAQKNTAMTPQSFAAIAAAQQPYIESDETRQHGLGSMTRQRWEKLAQQLVELGIVEQAPRVDDVLVPLE